MKVFNLAVCLKKFEAHQLLSVNNVIFIIVLMVVIRKLLMSFCFFISFEGVK